MKLPTKQVRNFSEVLSPPREPLDPLRDKIGARMYHGPEDSDVLESYSGPARPPRPYIVENRTTGEAPVFASLEAAQAYRDAHEGQDVWIWVEKIGGVLAGQSAGSYGGSQTHRKAHGLRDKIGAKMAGETHDYGGEVMTGDFAAWMNKVDAIVGARLGLGVHDLPDVMWRDSFDAGDSPAEAVEYHMENEGWGFSDQIGAKFEDRERW